MNKPKTLRELIQFAKDLGMNLETDNEGQYILYTNLALSEPEDGFASMDPGLVPFIPE